MATYFVSLTPSEEVDLYIVQTEDPARLLREVAAQCGSHHRAHVWTLALDEVQKNNCFNGNSVLKLLDTHSRNCFHLHIQEALHTTLKGVSPKERMIYYAAAVQEFLKAIEACKVQQQERSNHDPLHSPAEGKHNPEGG